MARVFITDAKRRVALAVIRSLGRRGIEVTAGEEESSPSFLSRYCRRSLVYPSPVKREEEFIDWLVSHLGKERYDVLFPIYDWTLDPVVKHLDEVSKYVRVPVVDYERYMKARNKEETIKIALENGIPCPRTYFISQFEEVRELSERIDFPVVIKPRLSSGARGLVLVKDRKLLYPEYLRIHKRYPYPLIQEFIPPGGGAFGMEVLFNKAGKVRAIFVHRRLREYPPTGGPSTLRESVRMPELAEMGVKLLSSLNWYGVAMVEFKVDPRDGKAKLMEVNPRFWGSLQLSIYSGVDFPYLLYRMTVEGDVEPVNGYRVGVRCRWIAGDILSFLRDGDRFKKAPSFFHFRGEKFDILSRDDPAPFFVSFLFFLRDAFCQEFWRESILR